MANGDPAHGIGQHPVEPTLRDGFSEYAATRARFAGAKGAPEPTQSGRAR
jgi:hypothetical protein